MVPAKEPVDPLAVRRAELAAEDGIAEKQQGPPGDLRGVGGVDEKAPLAVGDQLGERAPVGDDDGQLTRHRLGDGEPEPLHRRGEEQEVREVVVVDLLTLLDIAGEEDGPRLAELQRVAPERREERPRARDDEPGMRPRADHLPPDVEEEEEVLALFQPAEEQGDQPAVEAVSPDQQRGLRRAPEASINPIGHDRELLPGHAKVSSGLADRELAPDDDALDGAHHPPLDEGVQPARIEVVVVGDDRNVQPIAPPRDERRGPDEPEGVRAQEVEARMLVQSPDVWR